MKGKAVGADSRLTLLGGLIAVVTMTFTVIFISACVIFYTISPLRPLFVFHTAIPVPNTGYSIPDQYLSELGVGPTAAMYNYGLMVTGLLATAFFPLLYRLLEGSLAAKISVILGVAGSVALIGVGVFPMHIPGPHGFFSAAFFTLIGLAILFASYAMIRGEFFPRAISWLGVIVIVADVVLALLGNPASEWGTTILFIIWVYAVGITMILKRNVTKI